MAVKKVATKKLTKLTPKKEELWKEKFLSELRKGSSVTGAAVKAGRARQYCYEVKDKDAAFAVAWDSAVEEGTDLLEDEAYRRACKGTQRPVYHQGEQCGVVQEYSDTLMIFLLKGRRPDKYRENIRFDVDKEIAALLEKLAA